MIIEYSDIHMIFVVFFLPLGLAADGMVRYIVTEEVGTRSKTGGAWEVMYPLPEKNATTSTQMYTPKPSAQQRRPPNTKNLVNEKEVHILLLDYLY